MNIMPGLPLPASGNLEKASRRKLYRAKPGTWVRPPSKYPALLAPPREGPRALLAEPRFLTVGDTGLSVEFGSEITQEANEAVAALDHAITAAEIPGIVETVPSFRSLLVVYEPISIDRSSLVLQLRSLLANTSARVQLTGRKWSVPVAYAPFGEDLAEVSAILRLSDREIVAAHTGAEFRVYMLGFQPGLPNLGGLPPRLHISRRTVPRSPVPCGSVAIGGVQGVIMPMPTPTGFYLLGRTPIRLFDRRRREPALFRPGDCIRFREIGADEFAGIERAVADGDIDAGAVLQPANSP